MEILVLKSKTNQHRKGHIVYISRVASECCSVRFLEKYLQKTNIGISKDCETPLIGRKFKTKKVHKISKTKGISYSRIREFFKDYITDITANPEKYNLQSLDWGTSAAVNNSVTDQLVSKQDPWSLEKSRNGYIKDSVSTRLSVSKMLGL